MALSLAAAVALPAGVANAQHGGGSHAGGGHFGGGQHMVGGGHFAAEPFHGPTGYHPVSPPDHWNARPGSLDRGAYGHNFQAGHAFRIGPYHPPVANWRPRHWAYGQILPRPFWGPQYLIADYWLFSLEVPPVGCEWVRYGADALLINTATGEIVQTMYGTFG